MLTLDAVEAGYGDSQVLFGIDLEIGDGEVVTLLGRNGMGKTTTVRTIMGLLRAKGGQIVFDGKRVTNLPSFRIARLGLGLVPEGRQIFPNLTVRENLIATAAQGGAKDTDGGWTFERILDLFPSLAERIGSMGNLLSGGEQQMLAVGRALMTNPRLLILDEATEGLAPLIRAEIWRVLKDLGSENLSILVIDKNVEALTALADRHYVMERGKIVWQGNSAELISAPEIQHKYLGV